MSKTIPAVKLLIVLLVMLLFTGSYGADDKTTAEVITSGNRITMSFDFADLSIGHIGSYDSIEIPGLDNHEEPGSPVLPYKTVKILLPQGEKLTNIIVNPSQKTTLRGSYLIKPGQEYYPISHKGTISYAVPDTAIYNSINPYPGIFYSDVSLQEFSGYGIIIMNLYPVHYIPETGEVYYFQNMEVDIFTEPVKTSVALESLQSNNFRGLLKDEIKVRDMVDNPGTLETYEPLKNKLAGLSAASGTSDLKPSSIVDPADSYDYIIITNNELNSSFQALIDWKTRKGLHARSVLIEDIYLNYSGIDEQDKIRNFIIDAYNNWSIEYVLLGGDDNIIPHRGFYVYLGSYTDYDIPSDLYYAALDGTWDDNSNGTWGEPGEEDFFAEVYVGRAPVDNEIEVNNFVNKTIAYENLSGSEIYLKKALMVGEELDSSTWGGDSKDEISDYLTYPWSTSTLYDRDYTGNDWPKSEIISRMNEGQHLINHLGHANTLYALKLINSDINSITTNEHFLVYTQGCYPGAFDNRSSSSSYYYSEDSFCENLVKSNENGAFAAICNSRYGWYSPGSTNGPSQYFDREFFDAVFNESIRNVGRAQQDSKEDNVGLASASAVFRWIYYELNLLGDPETSIHEPAPDPHDISLSNFEVRTLVRPGDEVKINVTVNNNGQNIENNINITFSVDGNPEDFQIISTLDNLSSQNLNFTWSTGIEGSYNISVYAVPVPGETFISNNKVLEDIIVSSIEILLVDDDWGDNYESYYSDSMDDLGYSYMVWNVSSEGSPSASDLQFYKIVIWQTGSDFMDTLTDTDQVNLQAFLDGGGMLFISGQDIGYDLIWINSDFYFYNNYLHANFETDSTDIYDLTGVAGDPITHGINISISGGDGADNQGWPSEISPYDEYAAPIFNYDGDGIGALRVDTGTYRVVYFAFGFEAIDNSIHRNTVMNRILNWLEIQPPVVTGNTPENNAQNVNIDSSITATFSKLMNSSTLNNRTIKVYSLSDDKITGETFEDTNGSWNLSNFQGFKLAEELTVLQAPLNNGNRTINEHNLTYSTQNILRDYRVYSEKGLEVDGSGNYSVIGWLGEEHVAVNGKPNKLTELVLEQDANDTKTLHIGETWELGDGYTLTLIDININGNKSWLVLENCGEEIADIIIDNQTIDYLNASLANESNVPFFVTYLDRINISNTSIQLKYTWLISLDAKVINTGRSFGLMEVSSIGIETLKLDNMENVSLSRGNTISLFDVFTFEVEDTSAVRYRLASRNKTAVEGDISYNEASITATLDPESNLQYDTDYISYITTGVEDIGGKNLVNDYIWEFRTASYTPPPAKKSSSGGGGGGGGGTGEKNENVECFKIDRQFVDKDKTIKYDFSTECNIVDGVTFESLTTAGTIVGKIEKLKNISSLADSPAPNIVYKNVNIWIGFQGWATSSNIDNPVIKFRVEKSWITEYGIDESTIALWRYSNEKWNKLPTRKTGQDSDIVYFEADTPGFSPFAIAGEKGISAINQAATQVSPPQTVSGTADEPEPVVPQAGNASLIWPGVLAILIVFSAVAGIAYLKKDSIKESINQRRQ